MFENHSFDNIAGYWDFRKDIDNLVNLKQPFCNPYTNPNWTVWNEALSVCAAPYETEVPLADPDHNFAGTSYEIFRTYNPTNESVPSMMGFVDRESVLHKSTPGQASYVIKAYSQEKTASLAEVAQNFAFWDTYVGLLFLICPVCVANDKLIVCGTSWADQCQPPVCYLGLVLRFRRQHRPVCWFL
jgi:phospholipase C